MKTHVKIAVAITLIFAIVACSIFTPNMSTQPSIQNEDFRKIRLVQVSLIMSNSPLSFFIKMGSN